MTVEEAIKTALEYENKVRDVYRDAEKGSERPDSARFFGVMAEEEQRHVDYLESKLTQWESDGTVTEDGLSTAVPPAERIEAEAEKLKDRVGGKPARIEMEYLRKAHAVERETSEFYASMVAQLSGDARGLFRRFVEIEEGHLALVQAQIDLATGTGYWFDVREFNLEG